MTDRQPLNWGPYKPEPEPEPVEVEPAPEPEPFTLEKGKEQLGEAVESVKQAGKEITTRPILDAVGSYFTKAVDALIGFAEGAKGEKRKKK